MSIENKPTHLISSWGSYPKSLAIGHAAIKDIFEDEVIIEEKIDGSQFSFGIFDGTVKCRSKSVDLNIVAPEKMFSKAVETVISIQHLLVDGWTYRGEYLAKAKHNTLAYDRHPANHIIGFDINTGKEEYMPYEQKVEEFAKLCIETVPILFQGRVENYDMFREFLESFSVLGGQKIEGVVVKNYSKFTGDGKAKIGKYVSEEFKEVHKKEWKGSNPGGKDIITLLIDEYRCESRWNKAIHRLRDEGKLEDSPKDIGLILKSIPADIEEECKEEIAEKLYKWGWDQIRRGITRGLPDHYKQYLAKKSFEDEDER